MVTGPIVVHRRWCAVSDHSLWSPAAPCQSGDLETFQVVAAGIKEGLDRMWRGIRQSQTPVLDIGVCGQDSRREHTGEACERGEGSQSSCRSRRPVRHIEQPS
jgi:hypothetical protein